MGSFTSAPKILNEDSQDNDVELPERMSKEELLAYCTGRVHPSTPRLVNRTFQNLSPLTPTKLLEMLMSAKSRNASGPQGNEIIPNNSLQIRVLQWNLLSQTLGTNNDNFVCCPNDALQWNRRRYQLTEEIIKYSPDIICLQEVDHFKYLKKTLATQGYEGMFFPKPDSPCMYIKDNNGPDGCAIFYLADKFDFIRKETRILEVWRVQSNQVAIVTILKDKQSGIEMCIATTHLKARSGALLAALRNEQGKDLLEFVSGEAMNRPVVLCGDFNAEPTEPIYSTVLGHQALRLTSAYGNGGCEPPYTTWKVRQEGEVCHTIDYIFYSRDKFKVMDLLRFPSGEEIGLGRVPSMSYPSDHFSLVCDLRLDQCNSSL